MIQASRGFLEGFTAYIGVVPLFYKLKLWRYVALTAGIALLVLAALVSVSILIGPGIGNLLSSMISSSSYPIIQTIIAVAVTIILLLVGLLIYKHLILIFAAPWMSTVAEKVARHTLQHELPHVHASYSNLLLRSARLNLRLFVRELLFTVPLLFLSLIPILNVVVTLVLLAVQAYFVGAGILDYGLERNHDYTASLNYFKRNRGLLLGIGAGFILLTLSVVGLLVAPAWSAAAASYVYAKRGDSSLHT